MRISQVMPRAVAPLARLNQTMVLRSGAPRERHHMVHQHTSTFKLGPCLRVPLIAHSHWGPAGGAVSPFRSSQHVVFNRHRVAIAFKKTKHILRAANFLRARGDDGGPAATGMLSGGGGNLITSSTTLQ